MLPPEILKLTPDEEEIAKIEPSWADFLAAFRTGVMVKRRPGALSFDCEGAIQVHENLEFRRRHFEAGKDDALLWALKECCKKNVPLPYWLAEAIEEKLHRLTITSVSLHDLFGLNAEFPTRGKKGANAPALRGKKLALWARVTALMRVGGMPNKVQAVEQALREGVYRPYGRSKAIADFDEVEARQKEFRQSRRMRW